MEPEQSSSPESQPPTRSTSSSSQRETAHSGKPAPTVKGLHLEEWALAALGLLSIVGFGLTRFSADRSFRYWLYVSPLFAAVSLFSGWNKARKEGESIGDILRVQILHWASLPLAIFVVFRLESTHQLSGPDAGLVTLLTIALLTYLAGVHFDWRMAVLGVALAIGALAAVLVAAFFWVFLVVALGAGAVAWSWRRRAA
jgi:hypothetical protein